MYKLNIKNNAYNLVVTMGKKLFISLLLLNFMSANLSVAQSEEEEEIKKDLVPLTQLTETYKEALKAEKEFSKQMLLIKELNKKIHEDYLLVKDDTYSGSSVSIYTQALIDLDNNSEEHCNSKKIQMNIIDFSPYVAAKSRELKLGLSYLEIICKK